MFSQHDYAFEHFGVGDGISHGSINCIYKDSQGFLWVGTRYGLNMLDGYMVRSFFADKEDSTSLSSSRIKDIVEDSEGNLWIGTFGGGLNKLDRETFTFTVMKSEKNNPNTIAGNYIRCLYIDDGDILWIGTAAAGISRIELKTGAITNILPDEESEKSLPSQTVYEIFRDSEGILWVGTTYAKLSSLNESDMSFTVYEFPHELDQYGSEYVSKVTEDYDGNLWIATSKSGVFKFNKTDGSFRQYLPTKANKSLRGKTVQDVVFIDSLHLAIGTAEGGLDLLNIETEEMKNYSYEPYNPKSIISDNIGSFLLERDGVLWVGTVESGLDLMLVKPDRYTYAKENTVYPFTLIDNGVWSIFEDTKKSLWIGTDEGLMCRVRSADTTFIYKHDPNDKHSLPNDVVLAINSDFENTIWVGTRGGLSKYNPETNTFKNYRFSHPACSSKSLNAVTIIQPTNGSVLWLGTRSGLIRFNVKTEKYKIFLHRRDENYLDAMDVIISLAAQKDGNLWVGTAHGLNYFDSKTEKLTYLYDNDSTFSKLQHWKILSLSFTKGDSILWIGSREGLHKYEKYRNKLTPLKIKFKDARNVVFGIIEDSYGELWLSTIGGISKYNPQTELFIHFDADDGLKMNLFRKNAYFQSTDGTIYLGSMYGLCYFHPSDFQNPKKLNNVVITDFKIMNQSLRIEEPYLFQKHISQADTIRLPYDKNYFSIIYSAMEYEHTSEVQYLCILKGFDEKWVMTGNRNYMVYSNIDPGEYTFEVKASLSDKFNNSTAKKLTLIITPPWWQTVWFRILISLAIISAAILFYVVRIISVQKQNIRLREKVQQRTNEIEQVNKQLSNKNSLLIQSEKELQELNATKDKLFSIISHDLKNPFTTLIGFSELLLTEYETLNEKKKRESIEKIYISSKNAFQLLENLLDWSRSQRRTIAFQPIHFDFSSVVMETIFLLQATADKKEIEIKNDIPQDLVVYADVKMATTIFRNLLTNAIKFTDRSGIIRIFAEVSDKLIWFAVSDNGCGISDEDISKLFDLSIPNSSIGKHSEKGTGLGLILCKEFTLRNNGDITVESKLGEGSTFKFSLPKGDPDKQAIF